MSTGYSLRALLEDEKFSSALNNFEGNTNNNHYHKDNVSQVRPLNNNNSDQVLAAKEQYPDNINGALQPCNRANASLQLQNGSWYDNSQDDFDLEYMDLDEFLNETGLNETNFVTNVPNPTPASSASPLRITPPALGSPPQAATQGGIQPPCMPISSLEQLLLRGNSSLGSSPASFTQSPCSDDGKHQSPAAADRHNPLAASQLSPSGSEASTVAQNKETTPTTAEENDAPLAVVKKRKYAENGEGLTETTVVVVPGQDGFNPAEARFAPEDLQPQPIIKKSRKQFVPEDNKDEKYWKRRNKNNVAAKRSREARRAKENQIIMRAGFLESENARLTQANSQLLSENEQLKELVKQLKSGGVSAGSSS